MLRKCPIARFASHHSPEREQREVLKKLKHANSNDGLTDDTIQNIPDLEGQNLQKATLSDRQKFHDAIFSALHPDEKQKAIVEYLPQVQEVLGDKPDNQLSKDALDATIHLVRESIIRKIDTEKQEREMLASVFSSLNSSTADEKLLKELFIKHQSTISKYCIIPRKANPANALDLLQAILHKDAERLRAETAKKPRGIQWAFLTKEKFQDAFRERTEIPFIKNKKDLPSAFCDQDTMYFNVDHDDFLDKEHGKILATRAVTHEATHLAVKNAQNIFGIEKWINCLKSYPAEWQNLTEAVKEVFQTDPDYISGDSEKQDRKIMGEALSIYMTNKRHPMKSEITLDSPLGRQQRVHAIMEKMMQHPKADFQKLLEKNLEGTIDRYLEINKRKGENTVEGMLLNATKESQEQNVMQLNDDNDDIDTNAPDNEMTDEESLDGKTQANKTLTPASVLHDIQSTSAGLRKTRKTLADFRSQVQQIPADESEKKLAFTDIDAIEKEFSDEESDMITSKKWVDTLDKWDGRSGKGKLSIKEKGDFLEKFDVENPYKNSDVNEKEADAQTAKFRENKMLPHIKKIVDGFKEVHKTLGEKLEEKSKKLQQIIKSEENKKETGGANTKGNFLVNEDQVKWRTIKNLINTGKIFKDAILQNYQSNQKVKENKDAKDFNFIPSIEHAVKKLARSANKTETSEFKEYIETEGYTFKDVFGDDGKGLTEGLLYENRHNFNRAKAVIEYAADKAWLYFLDREDGHNVYGFDFIKLESEQSFEDLVNKHESGKKHAQDHGRERVNKDPNVPPMIKTIEHELHHKNIHAVQGIMERLQEKGKYSHGNTWMLTTLLMYIRDHSLHDPVLRKCLDEGMMDNVSNHTISQCAWSVTWLKMKRSEIVQWRDGDGKEPAFDNNIVTKTMVQIEKRLEAGGAVFPDTDEGRSAKYEAVAIVMSGKTFSVKDCAKLGHGRIRIPFKPNTYISLFDAEFKDYREAFEDETQSTPVDVDKTDPDFFNPEQGGSDVLLLSAGQFVEILDRKSTSEWTHGSKARGIITQIINRYDELKKVQPSALGAFQEAMQRKFDYWLEVKMDDTRAKKLPNDRTLPTATFDDPNKQERRIIVELTKRGLISDHNLNIYKEVRENAEIKGYREKMRDNL